MSVKRFEELVAWQRARQLAVDVYRASETGRFHRDWGLRDQVQRASVSVMSNIAEGFERYGRREFAHFLGIARGSAAEVRSLLYIAHALGYLDDVEHDRLNRHCVEVSRLLSSLRSSLRRT